MAGDIIPEQIVGKQKASPRLPERARAADEGGPPGTKFDGLHLPSMRGNMGDLANLSLGQWIVVLVYIASVTVPFYKLFLRAGIPAWIAVFGVVPMIPLIFLWILAFMRWPQDDARGATVMPFR